jgi:hypothetical protein
MQVRFKAFESDLCWAGLPRRVIQNRRCSYQARWALEKNANAIKGMCCER